MFIQLLDSTTIVSGLPDTVPRRRHKFNKIINERLEKIHVELDIFNQNQSEHTGYFWFIDDVGRLCSRRFGTINPALVEPFHG